MRLFYGVISILSWYLPTRLYINAEKTTINTRQQLSLEILYQFSHDYTIHFQKVLVKNEKKTLPTSFHRKFAVCKAQVIL